MSEDEMESVSKKSQSAAASELLRFEFLLAQIFITKDTMKTITTGLMSFRGEHSTDYTLLNAGVLISIIPTLLVYLLFQKYFVSGLAGSVKG